MAGRRTLTAPEAAVECDTTDAAALSGQTGRCGMLGGMNMRKLFLFVLMLAMLTSGCALASGVTDALGISGGGEMSMAGDSALRAGESLFVIMTDGEQQSLVRIPRSGGEAVLVESAKSISELVSIGDTVYYIRKNEGEQTLMRRLANGTRSALYTFDAANGVHGLSAFDGNLYVLIDSQLHIVYAENGMCLKLVGEMMAEYTIVGNTVYYVSATETKSYQTSSLLGKGTIEGSGGRVYALNLESGVSASVLDVGVDGLKYYNGKLYFHNLSDNYVMGTSENEWIEGKLYSYEIDSGELTRLVDGYDWGYYPMANGYAVYTSGAITYTSENGLVRALYEPEVYATVSGGGDLLIVYEPTENVVTYVYPDGTTARTSAGETGYAPPTAGGSLENQITPFATGTDAPDAQKGADGNANGGTAGTGANGTSGTGGNASGSGDSGSAGWFTDSQTGNSGSGGGSGSGGSSGSFTDKDS